MCISVDPRTALYARRCSRREAQQGGIASQVTSLRQYAAAAGCVVSDQLCFLDDGYSGATLLRPALQRLRDLAAQGVIDRLYSCSPERLSRDCTHFVVLIEEFRRSGVEVVFLE